MLAPVTKRLDDRSTDRFFQFVFYCDNCDQTWKSDAYGFSLRDKPADSEEPKPARELLWRSEHDAAYERANHEVILHFNKCRRCGKWICDDCFNEETFVCADHRQCQGEQGRELK